MVQFALMAALVLLSSFNALAQSPGELLPPWSPGTMDLHQINTGQGNAAFCIFPDGTTMLLDTGSGTPDPPKGTLPRPDGSRSPGEWVVRYIRHMVNASTLDYGYLSHFHSDHMGAITPDSKTSESGQYKIAGFIQVADEIPVKKIIDRGWPDYSFQLRPDNPMILNYRAFLKYQTERNGTKVERFQPGRNDQIILTHDPSKYPNFEIRNIASNGDVWTGVGTNTRQIFPPLETVPRENQPGENKCSTAIRISYGKFDYFNGGDIEGIPAPGAPIWLDVETPVAMAVGPVEACILNHHGNRNAMNAFFVSALRPQVYVIPVWSSDHPGHDVLDRMYSTRLYPGPRDVFSTGMIQSNKEVIGELLGRLKSDQGHILIRIEPGGAHFLVIILDDSSESYRIKAVHGPYESR